MNRPSISVLIPAYRAAAWLPETLESVLAQTFPDREIIVVDDGSPDDTLAVAAPFASRGVRIVSQKNAGASATRNHALRLARGEYIKFLDADDLLSPDMLAIQVAALAGQTGKIAYGEWARFHSDPQSAVFASRAGWHDANPVDWLLETWADAEPMMQCGQYLLPRELLDRTGGWNEKLSLIDDFEFFTRVTLASKGVVFTPGARLYYRSGLPTSLSGQKSARAWESAYESTRLATSQLLLADNGPKARATCANIFQGLVYDMYPDCPELVGLAELRVKELGGATLRPQGGRAFHIFRHLFGWKTARHLQIQSRRFTTPVAP